MKVIIILLTLIINIFLFSCTCESLIRTAERKCGKITRTDTVTATITTTLTERDTVFKTTHHEQKDTIFIHKNNLIYEYFYNTKDSTIYLKGECDPQIVKEKIPYTHEEIFYSIWHIYRRWILFFLFAVLLFAAIRIITKITK